MENKNCTVMDNSITEKDFMDNLWKYFVQHSNQRIQLINFYIILETFLFTGMFAVYELGDDYNAICIFISIAVLFFSFIFYNLDARTKELIKCCEDAIKIIEKKYSKHFDEDIMILRKEERETNIQRKNIFYTLSYTDAFGAMFIFFASIGEISLFYNFYNTLIYKLA